MPIYNALWGVSIFILLERGFTVAKLQGKQNNCVDTAPDSVEASMIPCLPPFFDNQQIQLTSSVERANRTLKVSVQLCCLLEHFSCLTCHLWYYTSCNLSTRRWKLGEHGATYLGFWQLAQALSMFVFMPGGMQMLKGYSSPKNQGLSGAYWFNQEYCSSQVC